MSERKRPGRTFLVRTRVDESEVPKNVKQEQNIKSGKAAIKKVMAVSGLAKSLSRVGTMNSLNKKGDKSPSNLDMESPDFADDFAFAEVYGPQLRMNKTHLAFIEKVGNLSRDSISVTNNGTTAIYYKWRKIDRHTFFNAAIFDKEERFFCHANKNVIKPGEMKTFYFTFKSNCTGIFEEDWVLECEPPLLNQLPVIKLSGHSIEDDPNVEWRSEIDMITDAKHKHRFITEILNDVIGEVRTPTPPLPDLDDPVVCKREFEEKNAKYNLYYTPIVMNLYRHFQAMIYEELHLTKENTYWDLNVDFLTDLINRVRENHVRENLERRWNDLLVLAKKKPLDRNPTFDYVKNILNGMLKELPHTVNNIRKEREMMEINFSEPIELSPEDFKKKQDEEAKAKAEFAKKQKKKPKNEEEEKKMFEEYRTHVTTQVAQNIYQNVSTLEENDVIIRALHDLNHKKRPDQEYFEMLAMKKTMKDLDIEEKRILLRVHLKAAHKIPLITPEEHAQIQAARDAEREKAREEAKIAQAKAGVKESKKAKKTKEELAEELVKQREEEAKLEFLQNVDEKSLNEAVSVIKNFLEQSAKLVIVLVSFGEPNGKFNPSTTLKYFQEYLNGNIDDQTTYYFEESCKLEGFQEKIEADVYQPNSALILENVFHQPEEAGYIYDENNKLEKLDHYQIQEFANLLSSYAPVYVIEDKDNIFKDYASLNRVRTEMTIFGPVLSNDLTLVAQAFLHCGYKPKKSTRSSKQKQMEAVPKKSTLAIIGGDFSTELILALNTILEFYDEIYIMGKIGILFLMHRLGFKNFGTYSLDIHKQKLIEGILRVAEELGKIIHIPEKLIVAPQPQEDQLPQWITSIYNSRFVWPDGYEQYLKDLAEKQAQAALEEQTQTKKPAEPAKKQDPKASKEKIDPKAAPQKTLEEIPEEHANGIKSLPSNFLVVGFEPSFVQEIEAEIYNARNILWIGSLDPIVRPGLIESNQSVALTIYNVKEERKYKPLQNGIPTDWLVSVVGEDLLEAMNHFDIAFDAPPVKENRGGDAMSEMEKSQIGDDDGMSKLDAESMSKGTKIEKRNNVGLVADIHSTNAPFVLNLIAGKDLETLNMITNYEKKAQDEEDEDFSFIDEI